jgi:hypothetical protein
MPLASAEEVLLLATFARHRWLCDEAGEAAEVIVLELEDLFAIPAGVGVELAESGEVLVAPAALNGARRRAGSHAASLRSGPRDAGCRLASGISPSNRRRAATGTTRRRPIRRVGISPDCAAA